MYTTFSASGPARSSVAAGLVGSNANDPVVAHTPPRVRAARTRSALASALHHAADRMTPSSDC
jgi:hypothetical protein